MLSKDAFQLLGYLLLLGAALYVVLFLVWPLFWPRRKPARRTEAPRPVRPPEPSTPPEWSRLVDAHEGHAEGHAERVGALARRLGEAVGLSPEDVDALELAALLHDVGELELERELFSRPGPLRQAELHRIWEHPVIGARKAFELTSSHAVSQWVRWHHESWDGLGYPDGLAGDGIPLPARVLRLADGAEAMLSTRPYRPALSPEETVAEVNRLSAIAFDPDLVRLFVDFVFPRYLEDRKAP